MTILNDKSFAYLAENQSRLADEMAFCRWLNYSLIEGVSPESATSLLQRFTDLSQINVYHRIPDVQRFLDTLAKTKSIVELEFSCNQHQNLFERLPDHCAVQRLFIRRPFAEVSDLNFLFKLKNLVNLEIDASVDAEFLRKVFKELKSLLRFTFNHLNKQVVIEADNTKQFKVSIGMLEAVEQFADLDAANQFITENTCTARKQTADFINMFY